MIDTEKKVKKKTIPFKRHGRELAMQFLYQFDLAGKVFDQRERSLFWKKVESSKNESESIFLGKSRPFAETIIEGVVEHIDQIDDVIMKYSEKWEINRMDVVDRNVMRIAVFEMLYLNEIPPLVSINEAIEIGKQYSTEKSKRFINGVLNGVKDNLESERGRREGSS